jgi:PiT family inorganic phosphate transporter
MEIDVMKKIEKEAIKSSGIDFIKLGFALFFMVAVLLYSFASSGGVTNN